MATDAPIPAREQAFAAWLARAILLALPIDASPVRRDDLIHLVAISADVPLSLTTGDVMRGIMRAVKAGEIEWCGEDAYSLRRRAPMATTLDASRLRAIADAGVDRCVKATDEARSEMIGAVDPRENMSGSYIVATAQRLALAEAREEGYRAAVADLLGAVPA